MPSVKKVVKISESKLVDLIENIVTEAVQLKKKEWIAEQAKTDKNAILEGKITALEAKLNKLTSK